METRYKKMPSVIKEIERKTKIQNRKRFNDLTEFSKQPLLKQLFLKNNLVEIEKDNFVLINDYFNSQIGDITIDKYKGKKSFICFFDKKTSDGKKNEFKTFASESLDFILTRICIEFLK
jgi:hypothetical protein